MASISPNSRIRTILSVREVGPSASCSSIILLGDFEKGQVKPSPGEDNHRQRIVDEDSNPRRDDPAAPRPLAIESSPEVRRSGSPGQGRMSWPGVTVSTAPGWVSA